MIAVVVFNTGARAIKCLMNAAVRHPNAMRHWPSAFASCKARFGATDPRLWRQLLMFAPEWLILETGDKIRHRQYRSARRLVR
jgi:hypothetical protein